MQQKVYPPFNGNIRRQFSFVIMRGSTRHVIYHRTCGKQYKWIVYLSVALYFYVYDVLENQVELGKVNKLETLNHSDTIKTVYCVTLFTVQKKF